MTIRACEIWGVRYGRVKYGHLRYERVSNEQGTKTIFFTVTH